MGFWDSGHHCTSRSHRTAPSQMPNKHQQDLQPQSHQQHVRVSGESEGMLKHGECCAGKISCNVVRALNKAGLDNSTIHLLLIVHYPLSKPMPYPLNICGFHIVVETKFDETSKIQEVLVVSGISKAVSEQNRSNVLSPEGPHISCYT